ncbi:hypothetical protein T492DRAFT_888595 [Pavlovales sp. CCMP2436]|nr:hypothetical protein T492DRAFT_888595 [Pavlovales sp. CCMP2436]
MEPNETKRRSSDGAARLAECVSTRVSDAHTGEAAARQGVTLEQLLLKALKDFKKAGEGSIKRRKAAFELVAHELDRMAFAENASDAAAEEGQAGGSAMSGMASLSNSLRKPATHTSAEDSAMVVIQRARAVKAAAAQLRLKAQLNETRFKQVPC